MKSSALGFPVVGLLLAVACTMPVAAPPAPLANPFNADEVKWSQGTGTATVEGQAFMKTRGGDVKYGAGEPVMLIPYSAHSFEWYARLTAGRAKDAPNIDPGLAAVTRKTTAGGDGRFKFENVPAGSYLLLTSVTWETGGKYTPTQGGFVGSPVQAVDGKAVNIIVTR